MADELNLNINVNTGDAEKNIKLLKLELDSINKKMIEAKNSGNNELFDNLSKSAQKLKADLLLLKISNESSFVSIDQLKENYKLLTKAMTEASIAGDKVTFNKLKEASVEVKDQLSDLQSEIKNSNADQFLSNLTKTAQGLIGGFAAVSAGLSLVVGDNKELQEAQKKSMQLIQLMMGLEQARAALLQKENLQALVGSTKKVVALLAEKSTIQAVTVQTGFAAAAQRIWNAAVAANPIGLLITAVAALGVGIYALVKSQKEVSKEQEKLNKTLKESEEFNKKVAENINKSTISYEILDRRLKTTKLSHNELYEIYDKLKKINPNLVKGINEKSIEQDKLTSAVERYISSLKVEAEAEALKDVLVEKYKKLNAARSALSAPSKLISDQAKKDVEKTNNEIDSLIVKLNELSKSILVAPQQPKSILVAPQQPQKEKKSLIENEELKNLEEKGKLQEAEMKRQLAIVGDNLDEAVKIYQKYKIDVDKNLLEEIELLEKSRKNKKGLKDEELEEQNKFNADIDSKIKQKKIDLVNNETASVEFLNKVREKKNDIRDKELKDAEDFNKKQKEIADKWQKEQDAGYEKRQEEEKEKRDQNRDAIFESSKELIYGVAEILNNSTDIRLENIEKEKEAIDKKYEKELENENLSAEKRKELQDKQKAEIEALDEKKKEIEKKASIRAAKIQLIMIGINTAEAITKVLAQTGVVGSLVIPAIIASGIVQSGIVLSNINRINKMEKGGLVQGPSHSQGGVKYEVGGAVTELEGGEFVVNKRSMANPVLRNLASQINDIGNGVSFRTNALSSLESQNLSARLHPEDLRLIVDSVASIPVIVSERDISDTQRKVKIAKNKSII